MFLLMRKVIQDQFSIVQTLCTPEIVYKCHSAQDHVLE
jgi:hypothetical protein